MAMDIKEEIANYLLNNCFLIGNVDATREKYYYVINHEESFRQIFQPIGYTLVIHRNLCVVQLVNNHGTGRLALKKYESIMLLIFRLMYVEKRESLSISEDRVVVTVEEIKNQYEKLNLPKKFDKALLEDSLRNIKRYNLVQPLDKLLERIYADNKTCDYFHKGDLDVYGFLILENLKEKTGIPFAPLMMDVATLERFYHAGIYKELTAGDVKVIEEKKKTKLAAYSDVLRYMLDHNCKVEQESLKAVELME